MTYTKNISRKKDFKIIQEIIDWNEYHPRIVTVKFDKNFFFYEVEITPGKGEDKEEILHIPQGVLRNLYKNGFMVQEVFLRITTDSSSHSWMIPKEAQFQSLSFKYEIKLIRTEELPKYFSRGSFY